MRVRIASYNIQKSIGRDFRRRPDRILRVLSEIEADIIVLQELDRRFGARHTSLSAEMIAEQLGMDVLEVAIRPHSLGWHGNAILVKTGQYACQIERWPLPVLWGEPRGAIAADLTCHGFDLRVVGVHLSLFRSHRLRQLETIVRSLGALPEPRSSIIIGDFNEWQIAPKVPDPVATAYTPVIPGPTFPASWPMACLDRALISEGLRVIESNVHASRTARAASDHLPVWVDLEVPSRNPLLPEERP